jgi:diguanylate cyclase (GGDEF)-like protein
MQHGRDRRSRASSRRRLWVACLTSLLTGILLGLSAAASAVHESPVIAPLGSAYLTEPVADWTWTAHPDAMTECQLWTSTAGGAAPVGSWTACASGAGVALGADGDYALSVRATLSTSTTDPETGETTTTDETTVSDPSPWVTLDTVDPAVAVTLPALAPLDPRRPQWDVVVEDGATAVCTLSGPGADPVSASCGTGPWPADLSSANEGDWVLTAVATDAAGNTGSDSATYVLDVAPGTPEVSAPTPNPGNDPAPSWSFAVPAGATASCTLTGPGLPVGSEQDCSAGTWRPSLAAPGATKPQDGTYTVSVVLEDGGGQSPAGAASYDYDGTAPDAPAVSGPSEPTSNPALQWTVTQPLEDVTARCTLVHNGVAGTELDCSSAPLSSTVDPATRLRTVSFTAPEDGTWRLRVVLVDAVGNRSTPGVSPTVEVDTTPPPKPALLLEPVSPSNGGPTKSFTWNWATQPDTIVCQVRNASTVVRAWQDCPGGTLSVSTATLTDGPVSLDLASRDVLLNSSEIVTSTVVLDTIAPLRPNVSGTDGAGQTPSASWTWAQAIDERATCQLRKNEAGSGLPRSCTSGETWALDGDGRWALEVVLTDQADNASLPGLSPTYLLDRVAPAAPTVSGPFGPGNVRDVVWTVAGEAGATVECRLERDDTVVVQDWAACQRSVPRTLDTDGSWVLLARLTDAAGNESFVGASRAYLLDTVAPTAPVVSGPAGPSSVTVVTWTWTGDTTAAAECRLLHGVGTVIQDWARCSTSERVTLSQDGSWLWQVRLTDAAGNTTEPPGSSPVYVLDTTAPLRPTVTAPRSPGSSRTPVFVIDGEAGTTVTCRVLYQQTVFQNWATCPRSVTLDLTDGGQGSYVVEARLTDQALNPSPVGISAEYVLDTVAPTAPVVTGAAGDSSSPSPTWSWTGEQGTAPHCMLLLREVDDDSWTECSSPFTPQLTAEGPWRLAVRLVDAAGNVGATGTGPEYRYDATAPLAPIVEAPSTPGREVRPTWTFRGETGTTPSCRLAGPDATSAWTGCSSPYVTDLSGRPQGEYRLDVRLTDAAGNVGAVGSASYVLDTVAPNDAGVVAPASPSSSAALSWTVSVGESGLTALCRVLRDGAVLVHWADCPASTTGSVYAYPLDGRPDGRYRLEVQLTDQAGNRSGVSGADYVYDTTAPDAVGVVAPLTPGSSRTPTWQLTTEPGAQVQCRTSLFGSFTRCATGGSFTWDLTGAADGPHTLAVRAVDLAGNIGPTSSSTYVLDTIEPESPAVTAPRPSPGQDRTPVWTWTAEAGSTATCSLKRGTTTVYAGSCGTSLSVRLPADGAYVLSVTVADAAGNASVAGTGTYTLDTTAPDKPVIFGPSSPSSIVKPVFGFDAEEGARVECRLSSGPTAQKLVPHPDGWQACDSGTLTLDTQAVEATYRLEVRATDAAGNTSAVAAYLYAYDAHAPAGLQELVLPATPGNDRSPTWTWTAPEGSTTQCRLTGPAGVVESGVCAGGFRPRTPLATDGRYVLRVTVVDAAGNVGTNDLLYVLDTIGPDAPVVTPVGATGSAGQVQWGWSGDSTATWECQLEHNGRTVQTWQACTPGTQLLGQWGDGAYTLLVRGVDRVGNRGAVGRGSYRWKSTGPAALGVTTTSPTTGGPGPVLWTFPVPGDATVVTCGVRRDGVFVVPLSSCSGSFLMNLTGMRDGLYEVVVRFADSVGNTTEQLRSYALVSAVAPRPGPTGGVDGAGARRRQHALTRPGCLGAAAGRCAAGPRPGAAHGRGCRLRVPGPDRGRGAGAAGGAARAEPGRWTAERGRRRRPPARRRHPDDQTPRAAHRAAGAGAAVPVGPEPDRQPRPEAGRGAAGHRGRPGVPSPSGPGVAVAAPCSPCRRCPLMSARPTVTTIQSGESVPLTERLLVTQYVRGAAVLLVVLCAALAPHTLDPGRREVVALSLGYGALVLLAELVSHWEPVRRRAALLLSVLLILDGIWLAAAGYVSGGASSPLRYAVLIHVGAVALVASYRTGLKMALWHSLLLYAVHNAQELEILLPTGPDGVGSMQELVVFIVALWLVTLSTSALSAVNERELRRRRHDLEALTALAERVERAVDSKNVARLLLDSVVETFDFPRGLVLAGPEGQLPLLASFGLEEETARRPGRPGTSAVISTAHEARATQLVRGLGADSDPWLASLLPQAEDLVVVPLMAEGRPLGALVLEQPAQAGGRIARRVVAGLERSASYAALALRNAWLLEQVQRLAATDGLTKIANRRTFESTLEREVARATRNAEHVSLVMVDIDHFKSLNDNHGHQAGDEVLRNVAAALTIECRDFDTPARYGGEEFAVVLPGCGPEEAVMIAERLRVAVSKAPSVVPITASAGVASYPGHAGDADTLVRAADDALYQSKRAGRNRTTQSAGVPPEAQVDALLRRAVSQRLGRSPVGGSAEDPERAGQGRR